MTQMEKKSLVMMETKLKKLKNLRMTRNNKELLMTMTLKIQKEWPKHQNHRTTRQKG